MATQTRARRSARCTPAPERGSAAVIALRILPLAPARPFRRSEKDGDEVEEDVVSTSAVAPGRMAEAIGAHGAGDQRGAGAR